MNDEQRQTKNARQNAKRAAQTPAQRAAANAKHNAQRAAKRAGWTEEERDSFYAKKRARERRRPAQTRATRNAWTRNKRATDPQAKLANNMRNRLNHALRLFSQRGKAIEELGCTIEELVAHLERLWAPGMTWQNRGPIHATDRRWQIDHVKPTCAFDLTDPEQVRACAHYTNLQPLWAKANVAKGARERDSRQPIPPSP